MPLSALNVPAVLPGGLPVKISRNAAVPRALTQGVEPGVAGGVFVAERHWLISLAGLILQEKTVDGSAEFPYGPQRT